MYIKVVIISNYKVAMYAVENVKGRIKNLDADIQIIEK